MDIHALCDVPTIVLALKRRQRRSILPLTLHHRAAAYADRRTDMSREYSADDAARLMVAALEANDPESAIVAVQVARLAGASTADVFTAVTTTCKRVGVEAAAAAGRHGAEDLLLRLVNDAGWEVRADAAAALGRVGGPAARAALQRASNDPDNWVQICADRALDALPDAHASADPGALTARGRTVAALLLGRGKNADVDEVGRLLDHPSHAIRSAAWEAIRHGGSRALEPLLRAAPPHDLGWRRVDAWSDAVRTIIAASDDPVSAATVAGLLTSSLESNAPPHVLNTLRNALRNMGTTAAGDLVRAFETSPAMRRSEGNLVGEVARASAIPVLLAALQDVYRSVRSSALDGLGEVGADAVPHVVDLFQSDAPEELRRDVIRILSRIADVRALTVLLEAFHHGSPRDRAAAGRGLAHVGAPAVPHLVATVETAAAPVALRAFAIQLLGRIGDPGALDVLAAMIDAPPAAAPELRDEAVTALGGVRADQAVHILGELLRTETPHARAMASLRSLVLTPRPHPPALLPLAIELMSARSSDVRRRAFELAQDVWTRTNPAAADIVRALLPVLEDPETDLADSVIAYLATVSDVRRHIASALTLDRAEPATSRLRRVLEWIDDEDRRRVYEFRRAGGYDPMRMTRPPAADAPSPRHLPAPRSRKMPFPISEDVDFSVSAPLRSAAGDHFILGVWIHRGYIDIGRRAERQQRGRETYVETRGPVPLARGSEVTVQITIEDFGVDGLTETIYWSGEAGAEVGNCTFPIVVPPDAAPGVHFGQTSFRVGDLPISRLAFGLEVGAPVAAVVDVTSREARFRRAFASYSSDDRARVIARVQGMLKILPELDIFLDVLSLRSGERWEARITEEILSRDAFLLFWSLAASQSTWVEREWKTALQHKGLDAISPVPLDPPTVAPPPSELAALHFWDPGLALGG
jgi:HEAT repeat protein